MSNIRIFNKKKDLKCYIFVEFETNKFRVFVMFFIFIFLEKLKKGHNIRAYFLLYIFISVLFSIFLSFQAQEKFDGEDLLESGVGDDMWDDFEEEFVSEDDPLVRNCPIFLKFVIRFPQWVRRHLIRLPCIVFLFTRSCRQKNNEESLNHLQKEPECVWWPQMLQKRR